MPYNTNYPELPHFETLSEDDRARLREWWGSVISTLEQRDSQTITNAANAAPFYVVTNTSVNRRFDVATVSTVAQLAVFIGILAADLKNKGVIA